MQRRGSGTKTTGVEGHVFMLLPIDGRPLTGGTNFNMDGGRLMGYLLQVAGSGA